MFTLTFEQKETIAQIAQKYELQLILLFGSYASGKTHSKSDIDIAIKTKENFNFRLYSLILNELQRIFNIEKIDLSFINHADPLFLSHICKTAKLLFGKKQDLDELKMYAFRRYVEHKPYFRMEKEYVNNAIRRFTHGH
jgi:predicted nucleotidyltransferase